MLRLTSVRHIWDKLVWGGIVPHTRVYNAKQLLFYSFATQSMSAFPCFPPCLTSSIYGKKAAKLRETKIQNNIMDLVRPSVQCSPALLQIQCQNLKPIKYLTWFFPLKEDLRGICIGLLVPCSLKCVRRDHLMLVFWSLLSFHRALFFASSCLWCKIVPGNVIPPPLFSEILQATLRH